VIDHRRVGRRERLRADVVPEIEARGRLVVITRSLEELATTREIAREAFLTVDVVVAERRARAERGARCARAIEPVRAGDDVPRPYIIPAFTQHGMLPASQPVR